MNRLDETWMDHAACRDRPDLSWIAEPEDVGLGEEASMAVVCDTCPVRAACETYANRGRIVAGFWAGHHLTSDGPLLSFVNQRGAGDAA